MENAPINPDPVPPTPRPGSVSLWRIAKAFGFMGATGFGTSMLPYYRAELVDKHHWITEEEFLQALKISQAMPGLNTTNLSVIIGDKLAGPKGSVVATLAVILPGAICLCLMGTYYLSHINDPWLDHVLDGVASAAAALLLATGWRLGKKEILSRQVLVVAATALTAGYLRWPLPAVLALMAPISIWACRPRKSS